ncbi:LexA family protein [Hydrogenovibrio marinus]|uniref:DNA polymerase V n=1 Tax=Hydrogenovibrio marinus TaxID=28885 RepID=A0A066ZT37_HYDMR|nr:translesion error-prone DNA polymerase V autoproteolytic subunit [Hydrogenovibrio marinus]KDN95449.1 DNA polymerase V [Hydrogenovibrio marinus]BBN59939.1 SOS (error prone) mutagenesis protein UmuD (RumA) [Hydrogenovibrio marinus]
MKTRTLKTTKSVKPTSKNSNTHGGAREGAGRKKGSGAYGEPTKVMRVPESKVSLIKDWLEEAAGSEQQAEELDALQRAAQGKAKVQIPAASNEVLLPLYSHKVVAGFPSPADDYVEMVLDLNEKLVRNKAATFLLTVQGDSMKKIGIKDGDILVVDKSLTPSDGKIVIAAVDGELTVKRLSIKSTGTWLVPENDHYPPILIREESDVVIWGVVTSTISLL